MVKQLGATCPGSPEGAIAGLGQVRHRLGSGLDLVAGGASLGASAERLRDRSPPTVSTVGFSAQEIAAESGAALRDSGGTGSPPNFTELTGRDLTADTDPAEGELLSPSLGDPGGSDCELHFAPSANGGTSATGDKLPLHRPALELGSDERTVAADQLITIAAELAQEEYREWADRLFPSLGVAKDEYREWMLGCELQYLGQDAVPVPTRAPKPVVELAAEETPMEKLKARLRRIHERRSSQTQNEPQLLEKQLATGTPAQQQRPSSRTQERQTSPVFENSSPAQTVSLKMTPDQTPRTPQPSPEFVQARTALAHCNDETVTKEEARSAAAALREILGRGPGSTPMCQPTLRRFPDLDPELERPSEPESVCATVWTPESAEDRQCVQQPARRNRNRRGRRGRRGCKQAGPSKLAEKRAEPRLMEVEEPALCFSPERRFDAKERRERPPRRYDKSE